MDTKGLVRAKAEQIARRLLEHWAPHLLLDCELLADLTEEAAGAGEEQKLMARAAHRYFCAWCAVRAAELPREGAGSIVRLPDRSAIWFEVVRADRFASREFADVPGGAAELLRIWFDSRIGEVVETLRLRCGDSAEGRIAVLEEWLTRGLVADDPDSGVKRRMLVSTIAVLREAFGSISARPMVPSPPTAEEVESNNLRTRRAEAAKNRSSNREQSRTALLNRTRPVRRYGG